MKTSKLSSSIAALALLSGAANANISKPVEETVSNVNDRCLFLLGDKYCQEVETNRIYSKKGFDKSYLNNFYHIYITQKLDNNLIGACNRSAIIQNTVVKKIPKIINNEF